MSDIDKDDLNSLIEWTNFLFNGYPDDLEYLRNNKANQFKQMIKKYGWKFIGMDEVEVLKQIFNGSDLK